MANIIRMVDTDRQELNKTDFASFDGDVYIEPHESADRAYKRYDIYADTITDPTVFGTFDDGTAVTNGSTLTDIASGGTLAWRMIGGSWVQMGEVT